MLVQVQSSLSLEQYSCSVKVLLCSKACFITGCTVVLVLIPRVLTALETRNIYLISIGCSSAMVAMAFLVHHRSEYPPLYTTPEL